MLRAYVGDYGFMTVASRAHQATVAPSRGGSEGWAVWSLEQTCACTVLSTEGSWVVCELRAVRVTAGVYLVTTEKAVGEPNVRVK